MATSPFDSGIYRELLHDEEIGDLFSDAAVIAAMMQVEGALAKVQGKLGLLPEASARAIVEEMREAGSSDDGWRCPACGEWIEPGFGACWRCAGDAPEESNGPPSG